MKKWLCYDTTLRDGLQENGREITLPDAIKFAQKLDEMGFSWCEAGFASSSKDQMDRIKALIGLNLKNTKVSAFGRTRSKNETVENAVDLNAILDSGAKTATLVGKTRKRDVKNSLQTDEKTNLAMIAESIHYLKSKGLGVIFDAEHFFDGMREDKDFTLKTVETALAAGSDWIVLCDTNGASTVDFVQDCIQNAAKTIPILKIGAHFHNDRGRGIACAETAYKCGIRHIQGTINGYGERCGNTDLSTLIPNLYFDENAACLKDGKLDQLSRLSHMTAEFLNAHHRSNHPWVGTLSGYTEAGMHTSGMLRDPKSYIHADLSKVGNRASFGVSEQSGKSSIVVKSKELGFNLNKDEIAKLARLHTEMLHAGYSFAGADASFYLLVLKALGKNHKGEIFDSGKWEIVSSGNGEKVATKAKIEAILNKEKIFSSSEGKGPVDALNSALAKILPKFYSNLPTFCLTDYRVKIINPDAGTGAKVRVIIESSNSEETWATVGVHENIIQASWFALEQSIAYILYKTK
ncbi:MAG: citramalate synthase [bacterium]|nr:citramalate synthase [bacterium]